VDLHDRSAGRSSLRARGSVDHGAGNPPPAGSGGALGSAGGWEATSGVGVGSGVGGAVGSGVGGGRSLGVGLGSIDGDAPSDGEADGSSDAGGQGSGTGSEPDGDGTANEGTRPVLGSGVGTMKQLGDGLGEPQPSPPQIGPHEAPYGW
jgi:hypothetical protein